LILLVVAAIAGSWAAPQAGLRSALILGSRLRLTRIAGWCVTGCAAGVAVALLDHAAAPLWQTIPVPTLREDRDAADLWLGLLYGGLTEEIVMRWGLTSVLILGLHRFVARRLAVAAAVVLSSAAFALAHLPAVLLTVGDPTPGIVLRTLLWNGLLGVTFGVAFARDGLEAAIGAHLGVHLGFAAVALPT
jgi:membrane protease YdiL (CAAX protease family)